jgi:hypothetical protein
LRLTRSAAVRVSGTGAEMGLRGHRLPVGRLPGGHPLGGLRLHLHVDFRGSIPRHQVRHLAYLPGSYKVIRSVTSSSAEGLQTPIQISCIPIVNEIFHSLYSRMSRRISRAKQSLKRQLVAVLLALASH